MNLAVPPRSRRHTTGPHSRRPEARLRAFVGCSAIVALAFVPRDAVAADDAEACIAAHANGQEQRKDGALLAARSSFAACAAATCPDVVREDCAAFSHEVEAELPSVVFVVPPTVGGGAVTVRIDSGPATVPADTSPVLLDPGTHQFVFVLPDGRTDTRTVTLREREKSRPVEARFPPSAPAEEPASSFRVPVVSAVLGGAAVLATGSFVFFGLQGRSDESKLDKCAPRCDRAEWSDERDSMRTNYLIADVSLGVALASLALGTYFLVDAQPSGPAAARGGPSVRVSAGVAPEGFGLQASGRF